MEHHQEQNTNLEWLHAVTPIKTEAWQTDRVIRLQEVEDYSFYRKSAKTYTGFINPKNIKGISYASCYNHYDDINWIELLNRLKRFKHIRQNFKTLTALQEHIHFDYTEGKDVDKFGDTLITTCGQHRLALAKFLGMTSVKVSISEYEFDSQKFDSYHKRKQQLAELTEFGFLKTDLTITPDDFDKPIIGIEIAGEYFHVNTNQLDEFIRYVKKQPGFYFYHRLALTLITALPRVFQRERSIERAKDIRSNGLLIRKHLRTHQQTND